MTNKCRKIPHENSICKTLLQPLIESEMPEMLLFTHTTFIGIHLVSVYARIFLLELENFHFVAQLVIALERHLWVQV
jgi:hypothetical protein